MNVWLLHIATARENNDQVESEASTNTSYINSDMFTPLMSTLFNLAMQQSLGHYMPDLHYVHPMNQSPQVNSVMQFSNSIMPHTCVYHTLGWDILHVY